ncbi:MAG: hypothetical protein A2Z04_03930 [Chloroflexi bacterium RBG_16_57_9]|nr:MAG: hypothetical protein A2Z04_03930 [Chloroflexi bacterium RBG_16_57_9]
MRRQLLLSTVVLLVALIAWSAMAPHLESGPNNISPEAAAANYRNLYETFAAPNRIDPLLVEALVRWESSGVWNQDHRDGEKGLMAISRGTWNWITRDVLHQDWDFDQDAYDPDKNIQVGVAAMVRWRVWLARYRDRWKADEETMIIATYNAGPGNMLKADFDPDQLRSYPKRQHIERVVKLYHLLKNTLRPVRIPRGVE